MSLALTDPPPVDPSVFINEIHYDNFSGDGNERVEIAGPAGTNLAGWQIVHYASNGLVFSTTNLTGTIPDQQNGFGTLNFLISDLLNDKAGLALVNTNLHPDVVVQFLSYEGVISEPGNGPAASLTSTDIGVSEPDINTISKSLQLRGNGDTYDDFTWHSVPIGKTPGAINTGQTFAADLAASYGVNSIADPGTGACDATECTLREAITAANADGGAETITFTVTGTINLTGALPDVSTDMTIEGPGASQLTVRRDTGGNYRIFTVVGVGVTVNISGLTTSNGSVTGTDFSGTGGGVFNESSTLRLTNMTISGNTAAGGGGGIFINGGAVTINNSTISLNTSNFNSFSLGGGGVFVTGLLNMTNSTVSGNTSNGGGPHNGFGGGIYGSGTATLESCTVTNNTATAGTGGGIHNGARVANTIVAGNNAAFGPDVSGTYTSLGYNLIENTSDATINEAQNPGTNITGQDPMLGPLTDNGGSTETHSLLPTSPAIDRGNGFSLSTDQRGFPRQQDDPATVNPSPQPGDLSDIGAFELQSATPTSANGDISGQITDANGKPVEGAVVRLSGAQTRKTITDAKGRYYFDNIAANGFYTVTPARTNYGFNPANRSFNQLGNHTEAGFAGSFNGDKTNPLDTAEYFVRQQYVDLLGREPDEGGFNYWSDEILRCGGAANCVNARRRDIAAAFFIEQEFQQSGAFIYNLYKGSLGRKPAYGEYAADRRQVVGGPTLDADKVAFAGSFVQRAEFVQKYQANTTPESFVDALLEQVWESSKVDLAGDRSLLLAIYQTGSNMNQSRSLVLQHVIATPAFKQAEYNPAFVLTEYFGYLRRNAEPEGYDFWLNVLNNSEPRNYRGMVCSFITSTEYQKRFSSVVTHSNAECGR